MLGVRLESVVTGGDGDEGDDCSATGDEGRECVAASALMFDVVAAAVRLFTSSSRVLS